MDADASSHWSEVDMHEHVHNTFVDIRQVPLRDLRGSQSDPEPTYQGIHGSSSGVVASQHFVDTPGKCRNRTPSPVGKESQPPEKHRGARPGRRERRQLREQQAETPVRQSPAAEGVNTNEGRHWGGTTLTILVAIVGGIIGAALPNALAASKTDVQSASAAPVTLMTNHSRLVLKGRKGPDDVSLAGFQDKLQFKKMEMSFDTQHFKGKREAVHKFLEACDLPAKISQRMLAAVDMREGKVFKKDSVPLDDNKGSYYALWMWVRQTDIDDEVEVAFKAGSLSYELRDVVTYKDKVDEEPIIKCTSDGWFAPERCRVVATKRTTTSTPLFKQTVMNPQEMEQINVMMEAMLAKKALMNLGMEVQLIANDSGEAP